MSISIYEQFVGSKLSEVTAANVDKITKRTYVDSDNLEFWKGVITVSKIIQDSRTYAHGLPIPEASGIETVTVADAGTGTIKPPGTEIWLIESIDPDNCTGFLTDGGASAVPITADLVTSQLYLTGTLYIAFSNSSGSEQTPGVAYHKVGL
jgi:hypothetical protein